MIGRAAARMLAPDEMSGLSFYAQLRRHLARRGGDGGGANGARMALSEPMDYNRRSI